MRPADAVDVDAVRLLERRERFWVLFPGGKWGRGAEVAVGGGRRVPRGPGGWAGAVRGRREARRGGVLRGGGRGGAALMGRAAEF